MLTVFLATVIGFYLVIVGALMLLRYKHMNMVMRDILDNSALMFVAGVITLILGLLMVVSHNVWVLGWPLLITLLSWLVLLSGLLRLFFPRRAKRIGRFFIDHPFRMNICAAICLIVGVFLLIMVYVIGL